MWSCAMKFALNNKSKLVLIDRTCKRNSDNRALANQLNSLNQNGSSIYGYYHYLNSLWKQFDVMISLPPCT